MPRRWRKISGTSWSVPERIRKSFAEFIRVIFAEKQKAQQKALPGSEHFESECYFISSFASFTFADSSFFCVLASESVSISAVTVRFHSFNARSQCAAASFKRPVLA